MLEWSKIVGMNTPSTVVVAMSGGVDSSVAAAVLVERGYRVIGMMLHLWNEPGCDEENRCCTPDAMSMARRVCSRLDIPFYVIDVQDYFHEVIVRSFVDGYIHGVTPNPCVLCNRDIRWGFLFERAQAFGADYFATGHYARISRQPDGSVRLLRGLDFNKDQSYVLSALRQEHLRKTLFPVGEYNKPEVRDIARRFDLPVASRVDSQDLCFLANRDYRSFLSRHVGEKLHSGPITDVDGNVMGEHQGLAFYTIGQRKGLGIASQVPLYVVRKDIGANTLVVGSLNDLGKRDLYAADLNWISGQPPQKEEWVTAKIRYKAIEARATLDILPNGKVKVSFERALRDITPGQRVVFYQGDECLGGGTIQP